MAAVAGDGDEAIKRVTFQSDGTRRSILLSYWAVILLALPLWWKTTSITRLALPEGHVKALESQQPSFEVSVALVNSDEVLRGGVQEALGAVLRSRSLDGLFAVNVSSNRESDYVVQLEKGTSSKRIEDRALAFGTKSLTTAQLSAQLSYVLSELLVASFVPSSDSATVVQYAPRYRLAFSLLNEDSTGGASASGWEIEAAIRKELQPVLNRLSVLHNFTIESQVQFYAPLAFTPEPINGEFGLTQEQLTVFANSAEWTLSSGVSNDHVLHFVLFVPSVARRPLRILDRQGSVSPSNSFVIPQWGAIYIHNPPSDTLDNESQHLDIKDLHPAFSVFRSQLLALLGVPALPTGVTITPTGPGTSFLSDWQLDALLRKRAFENARGSKEALNSILNLVNQIEGMPVDKDVLNDIEESLHALDKLHALVERSPALALHYSGQAFSLASRAFFNPGMLALLYFPPEHNLAVYTPLLAPVAVPLVFAVMREVVAWKKSRRAAAAR